MTMMKMMGKLRRKFFFAKSFSFIELIVTIGILGFVLSVLMKFFIEIMSLNSLSQDVSLAASHAQYVLEDIRGASGTVETQIDSGIWDLDTDAEFTSRGLMRLKNEAIDVSHNSGSPVTITATITWLMSNGRQQQVTFVTIDAGI